MNENELLLRRGIRLEYATLLWNVFECIFVLYAGILAHSVAMIGFGIDSVIEIFASVIVIWHLRGIENRSEKTAMKLIAVAFFGLALYIFAESVYTLINRSHPAPSALGIVSLLLTIIAMLTLSLLKGKTGKEIHNPVLISEAKVTRVDAYLASATLAGVLANAIFGLWWADPLAGLIIVFYGLKEGIHAFRE